MPSFQPKFFDKDTLLQMSSDLGNQQSQLFDTARALHSEKSSIRRKLEEVNDALAQVELELQSRPNSQPLPHTRGDTSSSPSPPTDIPLVSHESDYTVLNCSSLAMSEASHMAVVDDVGFQSEQHHHHFATVSGEGGGNYVCNQHLLRSTGRRQSDATHQHLHHQHHSRYSQMRLNAFLEGVQLPNNQIYEQHSLAPEDYPHQQQHHYHQRKFSTATTTSDNDDTGINGRSHPPSAADARRATTSPMSHHVNPHPQPRQDPAAAQHTTTADPATSSEFNPPTSSEGGGTEEEGKSGTLACYPTTTTPSTSLSAVVGGRSSPLPPNPLGEEIPPDSPVFNAFASSPPPTTTHHHQYPAGMRTFASTNNSIFPSTSPITTKECADSSAAYRYSFQLPHVWKHLGEQHHQSVSPPAVSLYHHRVIIPTGSQQQPSIGSRQPSDSVGSGSPEGSRTQSGLDAAVLPAAVVKGGGGGRRVHSLSSASSTPLPQNERPGHGCNVHDALQRRYGPEMFSYHPYLVHETEADYVKHRAENYKIKFPAATTTVFYVQMFPTELISVGGRVMESIIREVAGDDAGVVISCVAVTFNAVRATILTSSPFALCYALRCRVMADRHGFWYARTYEAFLELREYCSNLRYISQQERHYITDGLASIPLIAEFATEVNIPSLGLPNVGNEPYDFILGRDPNHKTTFPFERPKNNNINKNSPHQPRNRGVDLSPTPTPPGLVVATVTPTLSTTTGVGDELTPTPSTMSITTTPLLNSTSSSVIVGTIGAHHSPQHAAASPSPHHHHKQQYPSSTPSPTMCSSPPQQQQPHQPFNPNSRPRPPNEILQHYIKLQAKLVNILKGRNRGRGGGSGGGSQHR